MPEELDPVHILIVDDMEEKRRELREALLRPQWRILEADSGAEALRMTAAQDFAVVLLDVRMPGMDGFESAERIRRNAKSKSLPIIFVTGAPPPPVFVKKGYDLGAVDFLVSPVLPGVLASKVSVFADLFSANEALRRRSRQLEETLRQAGKMEAMGKLSGGIAHDFNNVLTAITGYAGIALDMTAPDAALREFLVEILKAGEKATALTRQLLAFSRQESVTPNILLLNSVIADIHEMLKRLISEPVRIRQDLQADLGCILADPVQVQQVLLNLAINARDSMPNGGEIVISTRNAGRNAAIAEGVKVPDAETAPLGYVVLSVGDSGTGMDSAVRERIFDTYFTTKQPGKGSGMGLSTVMTIVKKWRGHILVESNPGQGSLFSIYLPRTHAAAESPEGGEIAAATPHGGSETVLLAEDEPAISSLIRKILEMQGYHVLIAVDGTEASEICLAHQGPIDLLLTDLRMPGLNGLELAERFMRMRPRGRVVMMSGYSYEIMDRENLEMMGGRFIQKPFSPSQLAGVVREALDQTASKAE